MSNSNSFTELSHLKQSAYWREEDGRLALEAWRRSGLPLATFARQHGLGATRLRWWRERLKEHTSAAPVAPFRFMPVTVVGGTSAPTTKGSSIEIVLACGHLIRVADDFNADTLVRLVHALETSC